MTTRRRRRHSPEQIVRKLRDADAMLNSGKDLAAVLQALEVSEATYGRWRSQYGGMKAEEAVRLKQLEDENKRLKQLVADQALDIQMLKFVNEGNCKPFPEAWRGREAPRGVRGFRAKGMPSIESTARESTLPAPASPRRAGVGATHAGAGTAAAQIWLSTNRGAVAAGVVACE